jgi:hypothetical protein
MSLKLRDIIVFGELVIRSADLKNTVNYVEIECRSFIKAYGDSKKLAQERTRTFIPYGTRT